MKLPCEDPLLPHACRCSAPPTCPSLGRGQQDSRCILEHLFASLSWWGPGTTRDLGRPIAAPLERCAELLGVDLASVCELAASVEPYVRADGTRIWSLMQLERQLRPEAYGRRRGGYLDRRQTPAADA